MTKIIIASNNPNKLIEIKYFLTDLSLEFLSLKDFPDFPFPLEDGKTFEENAVKKALHVYNHTGIPSLGDDSGLEVDALNREPGIMSARYAGPNASDEENNKKLLVKLKDVPAEKRTASFRCILSLVSSENNMKTFSGSCSGKIILELRGNNGFGYDPLFIPNGYTKTFAELDLTGKIKISHRGKALQKLKNYILSLNFK